MFKLAINRREIAPLFARHHASGNLGNWGANSLGHEGHSAAGARIDLNQVNLAVFYRELNIHETKNVQTAREQFRLTFDFSDNLRGQAIRRKRTGAIPGMDTRFFYVL